MGKETLISWCDSTVNISSGCDGCELWNEATGDRICYAGNLHEGRWAKSLAITHPEHYSPRFKDVRLIPGRLKKAAKWKDLRGTVRLDKPWIPPEMPRLIFISDMSDALSRDVPFEFLHEEIIRPMEEMPHIGMWLTKQAKRLEQFSNWLYHKNIDWPANLWPGVSVTSGKTLWRADRLRRVIGAQTKFISYEPTLGPIDWQWQLIHINMLIIGGESRQNPQTEPTAFDVEQAYKAIEACRESGCAPFIKQLGANVFSDNQRGGEHFIWPGDQGKFVKPVWKALQDSRHGGEWEEWPDALKVREFPSIPEAKAA